MSDYLSEYSSYIVIIIVAVVLVVIVEAGLAGTFAYWSSVNQSGIATVPANVTGLPFLESVSRVIGAIVLAMIFIALVALLIVVLRSVFNKATGW